MTLLLLGGCGSTSRPTTTATHTGSDRAALDATSLDAWAIEGPQRARSLRVATSADVVRLPSPPAAAHGGARRGGRIDARFHRAPLTEALRLLASEAGVDLVIADGLTGEVTASFRRVRPLDALEAVAHAHGATIEWRGTIALIRPG